MKWPIDKVLPIALSVFLPVVNIVSSRGDHDVLLKPDGAFFLRWGIASAALYVLWHVLDRVYNSAQKYRWMKMILSGIVLLVLVYLVLSLTVFHGRQVKWFFIFKYFLAVIPFTIIQFALRANKNIALLELEKEQIQTENYKIQLEALRSKIDPHFLFNSLNTLRTMVRHQHAGSEQFILSLSDFYRQTLKYHTDTTLSLAEEIAVLQSYLFLMKSRNEAAIQVQMQIDPALVALQIPTLALQVVVENSFKHNAMTTATPLSIRIDTTAGPELEVRNNINPRLDTRSASGYGLDNLNKRYELLGITDGVRAFREDGDFVVRLKLIS